MITLTVIFGEAAVRKYDELGKLPSRQWLQCHGGSVVHKEFKTKIEYNAYKDAINECSGHFDWETLPPVITPDAPNDCPHCEEWRTFFSNCEHTVYCPDCGQLILNPDKPNLQWNTKEENHRKNTP